MTIAGTETSISVDGNGLTTVFSYDFYMGGSSAYAVLIYTDENGTSITVDAEDFTITGVTSQSGGTFTYPLAGSPIATGATLTLSRILPIVQSAAIANQGNLYPSVIEQAFDYQTMVSQQLAAGAGQTIDATSLFGNTGSSAGTGESIGLGAGLSFSGGTLVISGISGSGTVTQVNTSGGITGGPITGVGTVSLSTVTTGYVLANFSGATLAPQGVQVVAGSGISLSSTTTSLTISASGGSSAIVLIDDETTTGSQTAVTFSGIASTYTDLEIRIRGRGDTAADNIGVSLRFNGDSGANYSWAIGVFNGSGSASSSGATGATSITRIVDLPAASATGTYSGTVSIVIGDYAGTTFFKSVFGQSGTRTAAILAEVGMGAWASTSAITSVVVFPSAGGFVNGTKVSLYGRY